MPFNLQVQDQSPYFIARGGESLARGLESAGQSVGKMLSQFGERKRKDKNDAAIARGLRSALKALEKSEAEGDGADEGFGRSGTKEKREPDTDKFDSMGLPELRGYMEGLGIKSRQEKEQQHGRYIDAQIKRQDAESARLEADRENQARAPGFYADVARRAAGQPGVGEMQQFYESGDVTEADRPKGRPFNPNVDVPRAIAQSGYNPGAQYDDIIKGFRASGGPKPGTVLPVPGRPDLGFGVQSDSGSGTFLPKPPQRGSGGGRLIEAEDAEGKPTGYLRDESTGRLYPKKKEIKDIDLAPFDKDKDGFLNEEEAMRATQAASLRDKGFIPAGTPVGPGWAGRAAGASKKPTRSLYEEFQDDKLFE